jgi:alpha-ribazole phosphatase/probable phosphoglycerate mutase
LRRGRLRAIEVVFETAATTTDDARWLLSGWGGAPLATAGKRQARELGERRASDPDLAAVFASDLPGAAETARIAFGGSRVPLFHDWRLRGCDYGELTGSPAAAVEAARLQHFYDAYPGGESYGDVVARARRFLQDLPARLADRRIVVVGHPETKWAFDHVLEGVPLPDLVELSFHWQPGWRYAVHVDA